MAHQKRRSGEQHCHDVRGDGSFPHAEAASSQSQRKVIRAAFRYRNSPAPSDPHHQGEIEKRNTENEHGADDRKQVHARIAGVHRKRRQHEPDEEAARITQIDFRRMKIMAKETENCSAQHDAQEGDRVAA